MEPDNDNANTDQRLFERTMKSMEAQISSAGAHLTIDTRARSLYVQAIKNMSDKLRADAIAHRITWAAAAREAQETRNHVMGIIRSRSTPVGRAFAGHLKRKGYSLNQLIALKTAERYGEQAIFSRLSNAKQNAIYASIVTSEGKSNAVVTRVMARLTYAGRGQLFIALALAIYNVATASNKFIAFQKELAINGTGIAGGIAGGAIAGLVCGPTAPVCVTVGAFVGGALAAFGTSFIW